MFVIFERMNEKTKGYTLEEAIKKIEHYCAYQDRCHKEVNAKLREMGMIPMAIDKIMGQLIADRFLNEERFAKSFARGKFKIKKWGKRRIVNELKFREVSRFNITTALKEIHPQEYLDTLDSLAKKRLGQLKEPNVQKRKKKLADYLLYRGWESHLVYEKLTELIPK